MNWCSVIVFVLLINFVYLEMQEEKYEGDECELENDEYGICVSLSQCTSALKLIFQKKHPVTCSFTRFTPIVCCPTKVVIKSRLSERKCSVYKTVELKTTELPPRKIFDISELLHETNTDSDLNPDNIKINFTSTDFDNSDMSVDRPADNLQEEIIENKNETKKMDEISLDVKVLNKTENITEDIGTVFLKINYTEDTSKKVQDPIVILTNISKPDGFEPLTTSNVELKFNQNFTAENENIPVPLSLLTNITESVNFDTRANINTQNKNVSQKMSTDSTVPFIGRENYTLIYRGSFVKEEFPHMAALGFSKGEEMLWRCAGSLVSDKFVLTAAQCLHNTELGNVECVSLGSNEINLGSGSGYSTQQIYKIVRRIPHPLYSNLSFYNDIALLELERPVEFTKSLRPACLHSQELDTKVQLFATGWGLTELGSNARENLVNIKLDIFSSNDCFEIYGTKYSKSLRVGVVEEQQFCAGVKQGNEDTCIGDFGGPLQLKIDDSNGPMYTIVGIKSFRKNCGVNEEPGVYIRVAKYITWLESIIWPNEF